jgi:integrase
MDAYTGTDPDAWLFSAENGGPARIQHLYEAWTAARDRCGLPSNAHLHDLRHFGGTLAAQKGATLRELQGRLGHATARAALIYQHVAADRDKALAERMGEGFAAAQGAAREAATMRRNKTPSDVQTHREPIVNVG